MAYCSSLPNSASSQPDTADGFDYQDVKYDHYSDDFTDQDDTKPFFLSNFTDFYYSEGDLAKSQYTVSQDESQVNPNETSKELSLPAGPLASLAVLKEKPKVNLELEVEVWLENDGRVAFSCGVWGPMESDER